jgi:hypothetical protein
MTSSSPYRVIHTVNRGNAYLIWYILIQIILNCFANGVVCCPMKPTVSMAYIITTLVKIQVVDGSGLNNLL